MRSLSQERFASLEVHRRLDVKMLRKGGGPQISFDSQNQDVSLNIRLNPQAASQNSRLENAYGFRQILLQLIQIRRDHSAELAGAEVDHGSPGFRIISQ